MNWGRLAFLLWPALAVCSPLGDAHPLRNVPEGAAALPFSLKDSQGKVYGLDAFQGRPLVICYFRPGQAFSEKVLGWLSSSHAQFSNQGVSFLGVYYQAPDEAAIPMARVPFPILQDPQREFYGSWGLFILPTTIVLDREHRVRATFSSSQSDFERFPHAINKILGIKEQPVRTLVTASTATALSPQLRLAQALWDKKQPQEALALLEPLNRSREADCASETLAATALLHLERAAQARPLLEKCLQENPAHVEAGLLLGRALTLLGEYPAAESRLTQAAVLTPDSQRAHFYLGNLYEKMGRQDRALAEYRKALEHLLAP